MSSANVGQKYALAPVDLTAPDFTSGYQPVVDETESQLIIQRAIIILSILCIVVGGFLTTL